MITQVFVQTFSTNGKYQWHYFPVSQLEQFAVNCCKFVATLQLPVETAFIRILCGEFTDGSQHRTIPM